MIGCLLLLWVVGTLTESAWILDDYSDEEFCYFITSPRDIYDRTNLNWFACWLFYILLRVVSPVITFIMIIDWVLHVGRKGR